MLSPDDRCSTRPLNRRRPGPPPVPKCTTNARCAESVDPCSSRGAIERPSSVDRRRSAGPHVRQHGRAGRRESWGRSGITRGKPEGTSGARHEAIANGRRAPGPDRGRERVRVVWRAAVAADAEGVCRVTAPGRPRGAIDHERGAADQGLARRDRQRGRPDHLHPRPAQGARGFVRHAPLHRDRAPAGIPVHRADCRSDNSSFRSGRPRRACRAGLLACDRDAGRAGRRARAASRAAGEGDGSPAAARLRDGGARDREDGAGRSVSLRDRPHGDPAHLSRTVRGAVRRRGSLSPGARGAGAPGPRPARRPARSGSQAACADLARAVAGAVDRQGPGGRAAPGSGGDARADAARAGGGPRYPHRRLAPRPGPGRPALERLGHDRPARDARASA